MSKISVIIPVYNTAKYLKKCLDSVINQTINDFEIICVNDGSTDGSLEILNEYEQKDSRIKVISQENKGLAAARNTGLKYVTAPYVYFLDSDDYIESTLFEYAINIFNNFEIDYFCFGSKAFCEDKCIQSLDEIDNYISIKRDGLFNLNFDIGFNTNIHVWNKIFKTSVIKQNNIKFIEGLLYEDIYFMWYSFFVSNKAYFDNEIYHHYRLRPTSIMELTTSNKSFDSGISHMYNWYNLMLSLHSNEFLFLNNYGNLQYLLEIYSNRTKEMVPVEDKYKVELLKIDYLNKLNSLKEEILIKQKYTLTEKIFSVKNSADKKHKTICICGIKFNIRRKNNENKTY